MPVSARSAGPLEGAGHASSSSLPLLSASVSPPAEQSRTEREVRLAQSKARSQPKVKSQQRGSI
jgi:hypothetical protein